MEQKREYFRMMCDAFIKQTVIDSASEQATIDRFFKGVEDGLTLVSRFAAASREAETLYKRVASANPEVAGYLSALDSKIELLARIMLQRESDESAEDAVQVDLSAKGIGYETSEPIVIGNMVKLRLVLMPYYTGIEVLVRVIHCDPTEEGMYLIGANFEHILETDQEQIIQHVLDRQAALLRDRRA